MEVIEKSLAGVLVRFSNEAELADYTNAYKEDISGSETDRAIEERFNNMNVRVYLSNGRSLAGKARFGKENIYLDSGLHQAIIRKNHVISIAKED